MYDRQHFTYSKKHKRSLGFTLAETLITLTIIGVVAALTIPNLHTKYQKHVLETQFKKTFTMLNNALQMSYAQLGYIPECYVAARGTSFEECKELKDVFLRQNLKPIKSCFGNAKRDGCLPDKGYRDLTEFIQELEPETRDEDVETAAFQFCKMARKNEMNNENRVYVLRDGQIYIDDYYFAPYDGGPEFLVDINGKKGPNKYGYDVFAFYIAYQYLGFSANIKQPVITPAVYRICSGLIEKGGLSSYNMYKKVILGQK